MSIYTRIDDGEFNSSNADEEDGKWTVFALALREEFGESWWSDELVEEIFNEATTGALHRTADNYERLARIVNIAGSTAKRSVE